MKLTRENLGKTEAWESMEVALPHFDVKKMEESTKKEANWIHFGSGDLFRGLVASCAQRLLNSGVTDKGIIVVEPFDFEVIPKIYDPYDQMFLNVTVNATMEPCCEVIASVAESVQGYNLQRMGDIFESQSLQLATFTVGREAYQLKNQEGEFLPEVLQEVKTGLKDPKLLISLVASLLYRRFEAGGKPISLVALETYEKNGKTFRLAVLDFVQLWVDGEVVSPEFYSYVKSQRKVAFPWSMVDKRMVPPTEIVGSSLELLSLEEIKPITTTKGTTLAPFVNGEREQLLLIEDKFPNGRPPLEKAGVVFGSREDVMYGRRMKESVCFEPLQKAVSLFSHLLGYETVMEGLEDARLLKLVHRLGYEEGLLTMSESPVLDGKAYLEEVLTHRLSNPLFQEPVEHLNENLSLHMRDYFGDSVRRCQEKGGNLEDFVGISLVFAGWLRYQMGINDRLQEITCGKDEVSSEFADLFAGIRVGEPETYRGQLRRVLRSRRFFGVNLVQAGLGNQVETMFKEQIYTKGGVSGTLNHYIK